MNNKIIYSLIVSVLLLASGLEGAHSRSFSEEDKLIKVGVGAYQDGFYDIAEKQFASFLKNHPTHEKVYGICYLLGKTLLFKGQPKEARSVLQKILNENREFGHLDHTLFWLAKIEWQLGNPEEAKKYLSSIVRRFPRFEWIDFTYYLLGYLEFGSNKIPQSESHFKKVATLSKHKELVRSSQFWLGILSFRQNQFESASSYFEAIWGDPKFISQEYLKQALFWLGESKLKLGRVSEAKTHFNTFYEQFKNDPMIPDVHWRMGLCEYRLGNLKQAIDTFQSFKNQFKESPLLPATHYTLGVAFQAMGDYPSSIKEFNSILARPQGSPLQGISLLNLYWSHIQLGDWDGGGKVYQRLQKQAQFEEEKTFAQWLNAELIFSEGNVSDSLPYYFNIVNTKFREKALFQIGKGYFFENKFREAVTNLDLLYLEFPTSEYLGEALFIKGESLAQTGNLSSAIESYALVLGQNRNNHWDLFALVQTGSIHLVQKENGDAENAFKRALDQFPNHPLAPYAAFQMGNLSLSKKNIVDALHYYSLVLKGNLLDLFGESYFGLGEIFYHQGKYERAFASFDAALKYLKQNSLCFFLTLLEIGNLQIKFGKFEEAKKSLRMVSEQSKDEEIKKAAKDFLKRIESQ